MCEDELIPPQADMTEREWLRAGADAAGAGAAPMPTTGRVPKWVNRRTLLGGAMAGAALAVLPTPAQSPASAAPRLGAPGAFPFPERPNGKGEFAILVTGDAGTGDEAQYAVAAAARDVCRSEGVGLAVGLGDNIYENGPESDHDSEFQDKFEKPNNGIDVPWLMVLGNHDCSGLIPGSGGDPSRGDREVSYAKSSKRWYMPARYYRVPLPAADPLVEFFALDTIPWSSYVAQLDPYYRWDGPYMRAQRSWLDEALRTSRARWKVVIGHHPYLNNGKHGSAGSYDGFEIGNYTSGVHLKDMYEKVVCGRADLILSGHDHTLQILEPTARTGGTRQVVCGASAKTEDGKAHFAHPAAWQNFSDHGFMLLKVAGARLTIDAYTVDVATRKATLAHRTRHTRPVAAPAEAHA
ncbi:metallophosphoesterase [Streptomyces sp. N2A]|uniref:metallophosphoesterase n=1 Tax=Streptomyces sp. N2A TaxID=3073936 RepID=UPI002870AA23|nr:metallophosphoesterase [Streptomyces sp. N2A]